MNVTAPNSPGKNHQHSGLRVIRMFAAILTVFISTAVPALADTVRINQVVQTLISSKGTSDIRLSTLVEQDQSPSGPKTSTPQSGPASDSPASNQGGTKNESIGTGVTVATGGQQLGIDIVEEGEVEGTICDCGEILVAGDAFPKWPLLFLGAVPLIFISDCDDCDEPPNSIPTPTPTPPSIETPSPTPPPQVPEPASLLLLGTGLAAVGAGVRRRRNRTERGSAGSVAEQIKVQEEE
jgi:hypothetical protein